MKTEEPWSKQSPLLCRQRVPPYLHTLACQIESLLNKMDKRYNNKCIIQTCTCVMLSLVVFTGTTLVLYNIY